MMKVDILTPIRFGGPQKWGDDLVRALKEESIEAKNIHNFWGIIQRFFYTDADLIHTTLPLFFTFHRKPIILTIHGDFTKEKNIGSYLYNQTIKKAKKITVPSEFLKKELNLKNVIVIPNGIFPEDFKPVKHENKDIIKIVTITGFKFWDKARGVIELLKILEQVKKQTKKKFEFTVVGGGPYLEKIKEKAKKYDVSVNFIGFHLNPKEVLQKSDIFVYYSFQDNQPITIIEAMACDLPVISNDMGAVKEMIGRNTAPNNYDYKKKLIGLLNKKGKSKNNINKFYWNRVINKFLEVYKI